MKLTPQTRLLQMPKAPPVDVATRTLTFPFSSEAPVPRWYGDEVLLHDDGAADLTRLNNRAPLLFNHQMSDVIGVVERAWINAGDRRGYATVRFAKTARADEVLGMIHDDILPNVSFMYRVLDAVESKTGEIRVTRFEPLEISIVTVPADHSVGIGRAFANEEAEVRITRAAVDAVPPTAANPRGAIMSDATTTTAAATVTEPELQVKDPIGYEKARKQAIVNLVRANKLDERIGNAWITQGTSMEKVSADILTILEERSKDNPSVTTIGMNPKEVRRYSLMRAINASASGDWSKASLELEAHEAVAKQGGFTARTSRSFFVPMEIQSRPIQQRDALVSGTGGYLVATENQGFIELLRNRMVALQMGAIRLSGLVGNVTIPKQTAGATAYWLASETTGITEGNQTFAQLPLTPNTVGAYTQISRLLQLQSSPDAEQIILRDLAAQVAIAVDLAVIAGTGTEQPTGITATGSIGTVTGTSFTYPTILEFQSDVAAANALTPTCGYVTTPAIAALAMSRPTFTAGVDAIWKGNMLDGMCAGFKAMSSMQVPTAGMLFGDWATVILAEWGVLELATNPTDNFAQGLTGLRAFYTVDVGVKYAGAWSWGAAMT